MDASARDVLLNTTEILEQVFLQADMRTVLFAQSVCKAWHDLITTSPSIQRHLFLQPAPGPAPIVQNPLLAELFPPFFHLPSDPPTEQAPFTPEAVQALPLARDDRNPAFLYKKATWRRMLVCQPPVHSILRLVITSYMGGDGSCFERLSEEGITRRLEISDIDGEESQELSAGLPMRMETLFHSVTGGGGESNSWQLIWRDSGVEDPITPKMGYNEIEEDERRALVKTLERDGAVMLETAVSQCCGPPGPWKFDAKFVVRGYFG